MRRDVTCLFCLCQIVMEKTIEQLAAIRFCWKASFNATKTFEMIQKFYGEFAAHRATVFCWFNMFCREVEDQR